jgi:transcriptional regulator with XRE-family HTH domain
MERIRQLRNEKGLSQAKLAVTADMDPATLNRLEQGKGNPNLKTLERVAEALGVEVADILGKAQRRSSPEPSLFNGLEDERLSRFAAAIVTAADRWGEAMSSTAMDDAKLFGLIDAALDLSGIISERAEKEEWETIANNERREIVTTMEKLRETAERGLHQLGESMKAPEQEQRAKERREQIKEMTRRISA